MESFLRKRFFHCNMLLLLVMFNIIIRWVFIVPTIVTSEEIPNRMSKQIAKRK